MYNGIVQRIEVGPAKGAKSKHRRREARCRVMTDERVLNLHVPSHRDILPLYSILTAHGRLDYKSRPGFPDELVHRLAESAKVDLSSSHIR